MISSLVVVVLLVGAMACGGGIGAEVVPTVFVPTAAPEPTPTATVEPTPTISAEYLRDYAAFCDDQLKATLLGIEGPWNLNEVWDYALQQMVDCSPPYWVPAPGGDEGLELVAVAGSVLSDDLRYRNGRSVGGAIRVSVADGAPGGDGYYHW